MNKLKPESCQDIAIKGLAELASMKGAT